MIYKIIYSPKQNKAAVYLTNNIADNNYQIISVQELETLSGINFFPKMSTEQKAQLLSLPEPKNIKHSKDTRMKEKLLSIDPFANEEEVITIEELLIENRLDRISIHGSVDITKDKQGLEYAFALKRQIDTIVESLKREDLPERISVENVTKEVKNPFA